VADFDDPTLAAWGDVHLVETASGGAKNKVWFAIVNGERCVVWRSKRNPEALAWELDILDAVRHRGLGAPAVVPTLAGERTLDGVVVTRAVDGAPPRTHEDWAIVATYLSDLHAGFPNPAQRPGFASSVDLLAEARAGDVDLTVMPPEAVARCRTAWARLANRQQSLVHGDPGERNIFITRTGPVLIDWDECRVDVPLFDLAALPDVVSPLDEEDRFAAEQASSAWEAAVSWRAEPEYARRRLAELVS